jgi:hypothetical protein
MSQSNDSKFQEFVRTVDATTSVYNKPGLPTGWNCLNFIKQQVNDTNLKEFISEDFYKVITEELSLAQNKENVRAHVKKILMYPNYEYEPWVAYSASEDLLQIINRNCSQTPFKIELIDGKVFAKCQYTNSIVNVAYDYAVAEDAKTFSSLLPNSESCHITLVNSNIVQDIGKDKVLSFLQSYEDKLFYMQTKDIKSTTSRDWPIFSQCYVISIESSDIAEFLKDFNNEFSSVIKPIRLSPHITFAIKPRDLFYKM